ncbi:MAG: hypothetical protein C0599_12770 [Salinivirgaceae bacterium]|nr:MAG: hypothetical protein C0599_12770 [Salinivirgaceae bacterium]
MKLLLISLFASITLFSNAQQYINFESGERTSKSSAYELPQRQITATDASHFDAHFTIKGGKIATQTHKDEVYQFIHVNGFGKMANPGHPALPMTIEQILMPKMSKPQIKVTQSTYTELDGFNIYPALEPAKDTYDAEPPKWQKDEKIYSTDSWYPASPISIHSIQYRRGFPIALIQINPVQYNPVTGKIRVFSELDYDIQFNGEEQSLSELSSNHTSHFTKLLKNEIINKNIVPKGITNPTKTDGKNYIIITHDGHLAAADTLASWKRQMGYTVEIVSQSAWTAAQVKDAIHSRYDAWTVKPDYFVIIGDHDGMYGVPGETFTAPDGSGIYATDLYYACMDGYSDFRADMAFGRIAVGNPDQAMTVVLKTVNYERNPITDADFYNNGLACAQFQDVADNEAPDGYAARRFCHTSEDIRGYTINQGYTTDRIYYTDQANTPTNYNDGYYSDGQAIPSELLRSNGFAWDGNSTNIKNAIEDGRFFVFHRDHGYSGGTGWSNPYFVTSSVNALNNGNLLPVVFSINCHTGEYILGNSFAEAFIRNPNGGAVGVVAAAYYSYSGYNDGFSAGMIDAIWSDPGLTPNFGYGGAAYPPASSANNIRTMGDVLNQGLTRMQETWAPSEYSHRLFHYFGDPSMRIWTENPNENLISATHNTTISCDESVFSITDCSIEGAKVTLVQGGELIGTGVISSGAADIYYAFVNYNSNATLTITAENYKPYITNLQLIGNCAFPPTVSTDGATVMDDNTIITQGEILDNTFGTISASGIYYSLFENPIQGDGNTTTVESSPTTTEGIIEVELNNLEYSKRYFYNVFATNEFGTGEGSLKYFTSTCATINTFPVEADFRGNLIPACWESDVYSGDQGWRFDNPGNHNFQSTTAANGFASLDSEFYGAGSLQDDNLITAQFDFSAYGQVSLSFEHYFRSANSNDTATLFYTLDGGSTWIELSKWGNTIGSLSAPDLYTNDLSDELAGQPSVKFKWNYQGGTDYYWLIDDIVIDATEFSRPVIKNNGLIIENGGNIYDYTPITVGNSQVFAFTLENTGDLEINVENISISNAEFEVTTQPSTLISGGGSTSFEITYNPTDVGSDYLTFEVVSDATMYEIYTLNLYVNLETTYSASFEVTNSYGNPVENATIDVENYGTIQTDASGIATMTNIAVQENVAYNISHTNYLSNSGTLKLTHENTTISEHLTGKPVNLTFNVNDGTDPLNNATINLSTGGYANTSGGSATIEVNGMQNIQFEVSRIGYEDYTGNVDIMETDLSIDISMTLEGNMVTVNVSSGGNPIENATVTVQETYTAQSNADGIAILEGIPTGVNRSVNVEAENYLPYSTNINILSDVELDVNLEPAIFHALTIIVLNNDSFVSDATVEIDGTYTTTSDTNGEASFAEIENGTHSIIITKTGFETLSESINLTSDSTVTYNINLTGIGTNENQKIRIYPNPTKGGFYVETKFKGYELQIMDSKGVTVYKNTLNSENEFIDPQLPGGLYFIRITHDKEQFIQKVLFE